MNHNMGTHPISVGNTSSAANHVTQSSVLTSIPNQAAYLAFQNSADSYNGQFAVFDSKPSYMPHVSKEAHLYDSHCGLYGMQSPPNMSPSPPPPPRVYKPCVVCNDKSSGYHYGVSSCEGCKGFFRRSVQKNMQYTCHKDKHCPINKVTRNRCQYCRLQKCFAAGMSKEAVRNDRNKKRKPKPESASSSSEDLTGDDQTLIQDILDAHRTTSVSDEVDDASSSSPSPDVKEEKKESGILWERISELSSDGVVKIVDFAKKIPGFSSLSQSDQITLLKAACLEIMILRLSARYDIDSDRMVFSNGLSFDKDQLQEGGFGTLTGTIFSFAASLKAMNIDEAEFAILSAICLMSGDRSGLQDTEKIEQMQEPLLEALKHYTRSRRQDQPHIFAKLLMKLTDLRSISVKGEKQTLRFALDHLANALSLLEAPVSTPEISTVKTEPYSHPLDEPSCSGISSTVNLPNYDPHAKSLPQQQRMERAGPSGSMDYGRQMSSDYLASSGSLGPLPDSSIPSPLGMGLPPMQLSPNQISSVMASIESPSPSSLPSYPSAPSPSMPSYLTGLSPTLSPNFTFAPSTVSSILTSPIPSPGVDNNVLANLHTTISDRNGQSSNLPRHMAMTSQANTSQAELMLSNGHMMASVPMSQAPDLENGKRYNGDRNNSNSYNTNCLSFMGVPANLNAAPFSLGEAVASSTSDHHTPLSKIIAGAMTDTMQI